MSEPSQKTLPSARPLTPAGSLMLDAVRMGAAIAVAFGHFTGQIFSTGWYYHLQPAIDAVAVFFVLSGFVIRLITTGRRTDARSYAIDRASRMYSVIVPALLFTAMVATTLHLFPSPRVGDVPFSPFELLREFLLNVTFVGWIWNLKTPMSFNSVFWSLFYECSYYLIYGLAFFGKGRWRWLWIALVFLVGGPSLLFLAPLWLAGCLVHDLYQRWRGCLPRKVAAVSAAAAVIAAAFAYLIRGSLAGLRGTLRSCCELGTTMDFLRRHDIHLLKEMNAPGYVVGLAFAALTLVLLLMLEPVPLSRESRLMGPVRFVADGTFTLYLFHLPLLMLALAYTGYDRGSVVQKLAILLVVIAICVQIAAWLDHLKVVLRRAMSVTPEVSREVVGR